jgi:hypothetical protein
VTHEECHAFIGCINELNPGADGESPTSATAQVAEYLPYDFLLLREFADVIRDEAPPGLPPENALTDGTKIEHQIPLKPYAKPVALQPYKLSPVELDVVHKTLNKLTKQGLIRPSLSSWGAPVLLERKTSGELRMCVDYRALNHATIKYADPMSLIDEFLAKTQGYKAVSTLDLSEDSTKSGLPLKTSTRQHSSLSMEPMSTL